MNAEIITIGDEILSGHTVNTNASFISARLSEIDIAVTRVITVGDEPATIAEAITRAMERADVVITTGGLGPTHDDITRDAVVDAFDRPLELNAKALDTLKQFFAVRGRELTKINEEQAMLPRGAEGVPNPVGTAPGIHLVVDGRHFYALPGVPAEMRAMITESIIPFLKTLTVPKTAYGTLYTTGVPESNLYEIVRPVLDQFPSVKVAFLPGYTGVKIRGSAALDSLEQSRSVVDDWKMGIRAALGKTVYSETDDAIEISIGELLKGKNATLALAESCTGGMIAARITDVPGSSEYFVRGYVTYSNKSKIELLGVAPAAIEKDGAVSATVAGQMAEGAKTRAQTDYAISATGIAGPGGGTETKPVGLIFIAVAGGGETVCRKLQLGTERSINRQRATQAALNLLRERLLGEI